MRMIRAALGQAGAGHGAVALILVDLDRFGEVNDAVGDAAGDEILSIVAGRLDSVSSEAAVERIGDDEFALLVATRGREPAPRAICERILAEMERPFRVGARWLRLAASVGAVSQAPDAASMLRRARLALAQAKASGGNRYRLFTAALERECADRAGLFTALAQALDRDELELHYQPIHALPGAAPVAAEALLRWNVGAPGNVAPGEILATAYAGGLGADLERWVLRRACREAATWPAVLGRRPRVSVNVSPGLFAASELPGYVAQALEDATLDPARLDLELTEESLLRRTSETSWNVKRLAAMGVGLVLDDFGTGYANFGYLASLPVTRLKIDRSFVAAPASGGRRPLLRALLAMTRELGMPAVAEGVEDAAQLEFLSRHGCAEVQGFHLCGALRPAELRARLSSWTGAS